MRTAVYTIVLALCATSLLTTVEAVQISGGHKDLAPKTNVKPSTFQARREYGETLMRNYNYKFTPNLNAVKTEEAEANIKKFNEDATYKKKLQAFFKELVECRMGRKSQLSREQCLARGKPLRKQANEAHITEKEIHKIDGNYHELIVETIKIILGPGDPEDIKPIQKIEGPEELPEPKGIKKEVRANELRTWAWAMQASEDKIATGKVSKEEKASFAAEIKQLRQMLVKVNPTVDQDTSKVTFNKNANITNAILQLALKVHADNDEQVKWREAVEAYID